ncbi:hypothetical protein ACNUDN_15780 [Mycobacterium sp. smrl_JER01]|uniref:hypothetical protein n=1 Tax=Mycobacterium sp. smrl_JER01 TaxID=3402633 RepID=UPI003ACA6371
MVAVDSLATDTETVRTPRVGDTRSRDRRLMCALLIVAAVALWVGALDLLGDVPAGQYGLLASRGGVLLLASAAAASLAVIWAVADDLTTWAVCGIGVIVLVSRMTATLLTEMPIYVWTYKHIGIADYMIEGHASPNVQIYGDWPSFFALMAWFSSVSGLDPLIVAHWFAPAASALIALLTATLVVCAGYGRRPALIAAMLAVIVNWTGQEYYSPQAAALILALAILSLVLHSKLEPLSGYIALPLLAVLAATHQLTPFWLVFVLAGMALFRQLRPRWLPVMYVAILAVYVVPRLNRAAKFDFFSGFNPLQNSTTVAEPRGSDGREFTILVERGLFVALWLLAAVCFVVIWRRHRPPWGLGVMAFSPVLILAGQDYGGEAIIRVFLYCIAGCAALVGVVTVWVMDLSTPWLRRISCLASTLVILAFGAVGLHGYYAGWSYVTVSRTQVEHSRQLLASTEGKYVIGTLAQNVGWPEGSTAAAVRVRLQDPAYDSVFDGVKPSLLHRDFATPQDVTAIEATLPRNGRARALYVVIPRQLEAYGEYLGWFPPTYVPSLVDLLSHTPQWTTVVDDDDTVIFEYKPPKR